jgi:hypothetical protein
MKVTELGSKTKKFNDKWGWSMGKWSSLVFVAVTWIVVINGIRIAPRKRTMVNGGGRGRGTEEVVEGGFSDIFDAGQTEGGGDGHVELEEDFGGELEEPEIVVETTQPPKVLVDPVGDIKSQEHFAAASPPPDPPPPQQLKDSDLEMLSEINRKKEAAKEAAREAREARRARSNARKRKKREQEEMRKKMGEQVTGGGDEESSGDPRSNGRPQKDDRPPNNEL